MFKRGPNDKQNGVKDPPEDQSSSIGDPFISDTGVLSQIRHKSDAYESLTGLPFRVKSGSYTAFDHSSDPGTVLIGEVQLQKHGITSPLQRDFVVLHELGHFHELSMDPEGYQRVIDEVKRPDGLGQSYFRFYNALLDIYVNRNTLNRAPVYGDGTGGFSEEVKELYTKRLFKERDFTKYPKSTQYSYALLNIGMGVGDDIKVSPEVLKALEAPLKLLGDNLSTSEMIEQFLIPAVGIRGRGEWRATVSERKSIIDKTFRVRFEELVELDRREESDPNRGDPLGDLEGIEPSVEDLGRATEAAKRILREQSKTAEERASDERQRAAEEEAREHLSEEEAKDFAETYSRVYPQILEVASILQDIVRDEISYRKESKGFFPTGDTVDVAEAVERFDIIQTNPTRARIFMRELYEEILTQQPQLVRVWGVFDLSGSMKNDIKLVRELKVICAGATQNVSLGAEIEQHSLRASFGSIGYNDNAFEILPLTAHPTYGDIAKSYSKLKAEGRTYEAPALRMVAEQISKLERDENVVDIVVSVTDGETRKEEESKLAVAELERLGAKLMAFRFGRGILIPDERPTELSPEQFVAPPEPESGKFEAIWGKYGYRVHRADKVAPAMRDRFREILRED